MNRPLIAFAASASLSISSAAFAQTVDPTLLDVVSRGGVTAQASASSRLFDQDDPAEAFGVPTGPVEPGTFIFADNGVGGEESISFFMNPGVTLSGLRVTGGGAGAAAGDPRTISTVSVFGSFGLAPTHFLGSIPDFNDAAGFSDILFGQLELVDQVIVQFGTPEQGARVTEIDALVPEPASLAWAAAGGIVLFRRRSRE